MGEADGHWICFLEANAGLAGLADTGTALPTQGLQPVKGGQLRKQGRMLVGHPVRLFKKHFGGNGKKLGGGDRNSNRMRPSIARILGYRGGLIL